MPPQRAHHEPAQNPPEWEPPGLSAPLAGHFTVALVKTPIVLALTCMAGAVMGSPWPEASELVAATAVLTILDVVVTVWAERPFVIRRRLMSPGGWDFALLPWVLSAAISYAAGWALLGNPFGSILATAMTVVEGVEVLFRRAWRPGDTDAGYHEKWVRTKAMTEEMFVPDTAEIRHRLYERAMDGYRRKIRERERELGLRGPDEEGDVHP
jgi:hypothetical protein